MKEENKLIKRKIRGVYAMLIVSALFFTASVCFVVKDFVVLSNYDKIDATITRLDQVRVADDVSYDVAVSFDYQGNAYQDVAVSYNFTMKLDKTIKVYVDKDNPVKDVVTIADLIVIPIFFSAFGLFTVVFALLDFKSLTGNSQEE